MDVREWVRLLVKPADGDPDRIGPVMIAVGVVLLLLVFVVLPIAEALGLVHLVW